MFCRLRAGLLFVIGALSSPVAAENIVFPADAGVIDVTKAPYHARGDGRTDDTAAIQRALDDHPSNNCIIYLPHGTYLVSDTLRWPEGKRGGLEQKRTILQGQSEAGTIVKLPDNAENFQDADKPRAVIWTGERPAQRFRNAIRNLTVNTGSGNRGAIGVRFIASNQGGLWHVTIASGDGQGVVGLDMKFTDEIGPLLVHDLTVEGFDYGIQTFWQTASVTFEDVTLRNQNKLGWENFGQATFIRGLRSSGEVTVIKNVKDGASQITLIDADLQGSGRASELPAIWNQKGMYLRNIKTSGFARAVKHDDKGRGNTAGVAATDVQEWLSHGEAVSLFPSPATSLNLPVRETPRAKWDELSAWASPLQFGGKPNDKLDDTAAIQQAIDSGATTIYLPNGTWLLGGEVVLHGAVQRLLGTEARLNGKGVVRLADGKPETVVVERLDIDGVDLVHDATRTWVLASLLGGKYRNTPRGTGDLFLEDVVMGTFVFRNQNVWARQLDQETDTQKTGEPAKVTCDAARLWVLGLKTEKAGTILHAARGSTVEVVGAFLLSNGDPKRTPAFVVKDSSLSLAGVAERSFGGDAIGTWVEETRAGETRALQNFGRTQLFVGAMQP